MTIRVEVLENKQIINFYMPVSCGQSGGVTVADRVHRSSDTTIGRILDVEGVKRCLVSDVVVSVSYEDNADDVRLWVLAELDDFIQENRDPIKFEQLTTAMVTAQAVADAFIRPTLNRDNGDIDILSYEDGILTVRFTGHCAGCPYAQNTLQNVIVKTFKSYMPQVQSIKLEETK